MGVVGNGADVTSSIVVSVTSIVEGDVVKEKEREKKKKKERKEKRGGREERESLRVWGVLRCG